MKKIVLITLVLFFMIAMIFSRSVMAGPDCGHCHRPAKIVIDCSALCCQPINFVFAGIFHEPVIPQAYDFVSQPFLYAKNIAREVFHPPRHAVFL